MLLLYSEVQGTSKKAVKVHGVKLFYKKSAEPVARNRKKCTDPPAFVGLIALQGESSVAAECYSAWPFTRPQTAHEND
jgi:hypothetical protein